MQENLYKYFSTEKNFICLANKKDDNPVIKLIKYETYKEEAE